MDGTYDVEEEYEFWKIQPKQFNNTNLEPFDSQPSKCA